MAQRIKLYIVLLAIWGLFALCETTYGDSKIYWTDRDAGVIQRANLDGSSIENIITDVVKPHGIAIDTTDGKMYWCEVG